MRFEKHNYEMTILEKHLDSFGHVNNATYLEILEEARWDMLTQKGFGYEVVHEKKIGPTILEINLRFRRELRNRQRVWIETQMTAYDGKIGTLIQEIKNERGDVHCAAQLTVGLFDMQARRLIPPSPEWLRAVGADVGS